MSENELKNIEIVGAHIVNGDVVEIGVRYKGCPSFSMYSSSSKTITELKKQNEILLDAVKFYADHTHVDYNTKKAKEVLQQIEGVE